MTLPTDPTLLLAGGTSPYYQVQRSLRFRRSASAYLNRTPSTAGNRKLWTWSGWVKRGILTTANIGLFSATSGSETLDICFEGNTGAAADSIRFVYYTGAALNGNLVTTPLYRDPSGWYHIVAIWDTDNATSSNRMRIFVNGSEVTAFSTSSYPTLGTSGLINNTVAHAIGRYSNTTSYFDGYLAEVNFIDGQALTPSSFGYSDPTTGVWMPKKYQGAYGTNGFYLTFQDNSAATAASIGKDWSGVNTNNWTPNNISVTSGVTYDSMLDVPTNWADGGNGRGNYAVLNPVVPSGGTYSNANLKYVGPSSWAVARATIELPSTGKWYFEGTVAAAGQNNTLNSSYSTIGIASSSSSVTGLSYNAANYVTLTDTGWLNNNGTTSNAVGAALSANDIIGVAIDVGANTFTFYRNNTSVATGTIGITAGTPLVFINGSYNATYGNFQVNFGQRPFSYTPPSGYLALNTQNLSTPTILNGANYMAAVTYNGTSASNTVVATSTNSGNNPLAVTFQPDLVWIKSRSAATNHEITDAVRGVTKSLNSNTTAAEATDTNGLTSFTPAGVNGFTVGSDSNYNNGTGPATYVAWEWQAGKGSSSIPSGGTITPTGASINTTAGFSIITYTGTGANATIPHGLGAAPVFILIKARSGSSDWAVYHSSIGATQYLVLNTTAATSTNATVWNNTTPTPTVFSVGTAVGVNFSSSATYVAYCWTAIPGFSAFGSFTANNSTDGNFIYLGFRPRWIMTKQTSGSGGNWFILDTSRNTYNVMNNILDANLADAERTANIWDVTSNGMKLRIALSGDFVYAAFAENPFKVSRAR